MRIIAGNFYRPEIDFSTVNIDTSASDPVGTCSCVVTDTGSLIIIPEMSELIVIDDDAYPLPPAHNLMTNPTWNPYTTNWTVTNQTGFTFAQNGGGGFKLTAANVGGGAIASLSQTTALPTVSQPGTMLSSPLMSAGQKYMLSVYAQGASATNIQAYLELDFNDAAGNQISLQTNFATVSNSNQRFTLQATADPNTVSITVKIGVWPSSGTNSGSITFTNVQVEPMLFPDIVYPTSDCNVTQANCVVLPNGTTVRQKRIFTGWVLTVEYGNYAGQNREITLNASSPAWYLDFRLPSNTYTNKTDLFMIQDSLTTYFTGLFSFNHMIVGVTYASFNQNRDTMRNIVDNIAAAADFRWTIDPYYDVWYLPAGYLTASYTLVDQASNPSMAQYVYSKYHKLVDFTQPVNETNVIESGGPSAILVTDAQSRSRYGFRFDNKVDDSTITTDTDAYNRGVATVLNYSMPRIVLTLELDERASQAEIVAGNAIQVTHSIEGYTAVAFIIQKVHMSVLGVDKTQKTRYLYQLALGKYNADLISLLARQQRIAAQPSTTSLTFGPERVLAYEPIGLTDSQTHTP